MFILDWQNTDLIGGGGSGGTHSVDIRPYGYFIAVCIPLCNGTASLLRKVILVTVLIKWLHEIQLRHVTNCESFRLRLVGRCKWSYFQICYCYL